MRRRYQKISGEQGNFIRRVARAVVEERRSRNPNERMTLNILFSGEDSTERIIYYNLVVSQLRRGMVDYDLGRYLFNLLGGIESLRFLEDVDNYRFTRGLRGYLDNTDLPI